MPESNTVKIIPVNFTGPVCSRCRFAIVSKLDPEDGRAWRCSAVPRTVTRVEQLNTVTGETCAEISHRPSCVDRNNDGECTDFMEPDSTDDSDTSTSDDPYRGVVDSSATAVPQVKTGARAWMSAMVIQIGVWIGE